MRRMVQLYLAMMLVACGNAGDKQETQTLDNKATATTDKPTMYVPEGLAKLMRIMEAHGDSVHTAVEDGATFPSYPTAIDSQLTATPTEGMHIDPITFPVFAAE